MGSLQQKIATLYADSRSLWVPECIQEYRGEGELVPFLRDHAGQSVPCVWRGAAAGWSALEKWPDEGFQYLRENFGNKLVEVAITPDGRADAILEVQDDASGRIEKVFAMPHQSIQPFAELLDNLRDEPTTHAALGCRQVADCQAHTTDVHYVPYYSAQDSSLTREVPELLGDIDLSTIQFAEAAFGSKPSAANLWIGDGRSVTTMHADPFENIYAVVSGTKLFELRPPCDAAVLTKPSLRHVRWVPVERDGHDQQEDHDEASWRKDSIHPCNHYAGWSIAIEEGRSEWIDEDRIQQEWNRSLQVEVNPGDLLYLPALWCK